MRLWTQQGQGFSLTGGRVDPAKSGYAHDPSIMVAYQRLFSLLNTNQFLWCWTTEPDSLLDNPSKKLWHLDVPDDGMLASIDDLRWHKIIGHDDACFDYDSKLANARKKFPDDRKAIDANIREQIRAEFDAIGDINSCWSQLIPDSTTSSSYCSILVTFPLLTSWIIT